MENSSIQWTHHTFNGWIGCSKVAGHPGCAHCYAEADMDLRRHRVKWGPHGTRSRTSDAYWKLPLRWNREAEKAGERRRVFCASLADVFEDWQGPIVDSINRRVFVAPSGKYCPEGLGSPVSDKGWRPVTMDDLRRDLFRLIDQTPWLDWLVLTKRPENVQRMWVSIDEKSASLDVLLSRHFRAVNSRIAKGGHLNPACSEAAAYEWERLRDNHRPNVHLGYSASDQKSLGKGVLHLFRCRSLCQLLFLSLEPLLGEINLITPGYLTDCPEVAEYNLAHYGDSQPLSWVIVGGESSQGGKEARLMDLAWARDILEQCKVAGVAAFMKQLGSNPCHGEHDGVPHEPGDVTKPRTVGDGFGRYYVKLKDSHGGDPAEWPADLRVREFPDLCAVANR